METEINLRLNADLYRAAEQIHVGCDADYIDDLCKEIAENHNQNYDMIKNRVKVTYQHYFKES